MFGMLLTACENYEEAPTTPEISVKPGVLHFTSEGGKQEVTITSNSEYEVSATADWVTFTKTDKGITVSVPNYTEVEKRSADITITSLKYDISKTIKVEQSALIPKISVKPEILNFDIEGGKQEVTITSNIEYEVSVNADWITFTKTNNGIAVTVPNNTEVEKRIAIITISSEKYNISKTIRVEQKAFAPKISVEPETLNFYYDGGKQEVTITSNFEYEVSVNADWITFTKTNNGIAITAPINTEGEERSADITISSEKYNISKTVKVSQTAKNVIIYTSYYDDVVTPNSETVFGANIVSNTYENGKGIIKFNAPVTKIGSNAFEDCHSLTSITIPNGVTVIEYCAFYECSSLTSVTIPNGVTEIENDAFYNCSSLTSVTIPNSVSSIGSYAFKGCI